MAIAFDILGFAAKIAVDRLTGSSERTEEAIRLFKNWTTQSNTEAVSSEFAEAKREAADQTTLHQAIEKAIVESGQGLSDEKRQAIEFSVISGLSSLPTDVEGSAATVDNLVEQLLPGKSRSYVIWMDISEVVGKSEMSRYFHFSYDG